MTAIAIMTPWAVYYRHREWIDVNSTLPTMYICEQNWPSPDHESGYFLGAIFLTCYTVPLILISACYVFICLKVWNRNAPGIVNTSQVIYRSKVKVLKMLIVVVILFAFSWLPLYAINVRRYFGPPLTHSSLEFRLLSQIILPIAQWLGSSNSCVNPIIYCFFSKKFRKGFKDFIHCCRKAQYSNTYFVRNSSAVYRSVNDGNGHTLYTSIRSQNPDKKVNKDDITCF